MRHARFSIGLAIAVLLAPIAGLLVRPAIAADEVTLKGEVVDMACYIGQQAKGPDHKKCAQKCAEMGQPLGLLAEDGKVYLLIADHVNQAPFQKARQKAGDQVTIKGSVESHDGVNALTVLDIK